MQLVSNNQLQDKFLIVNINIPSYKLPDFVDRVPMVFIKGRNELVIDDNIPKFIDSIKPQQSQQSQQQSQQSQQQQPIMTLSDISSGISDKFSFIGGGNSMGAGNFEFLDGSGVGPTAPTAPAAPTSASAERPSKFDTNDYERFTAQRDMDEASFKKMPPPRI